jgi:hypothetical protein
MLAIYQLAKFQDMLFAHSMQEIDVNALHQQAEEVRAMLTAVFGSQLWQFPKFHSLHGVHLQGPETLIE